MADAFESYQSGLTGPYTDAAAVTPNDSTDIDVTRALYIGGAGDGTLSVITAEGSTVAFAGLTANTILPIRVSRVRNSGTGVTNIVALY